MEIFLKIRKCKVCKREFKQKKEWQKYCGSRCKTAAANARKASLLRRAKRIVAAQAVRQ